MLIKTILFWKRFVASLACELFMISNMRLIFFFWPIRPSTSLKVAWVQGFIVPLAFFDLFALFENRKLLWALCMATRRFFYFWVLSRHWLLLLLNIFHTNIPLAFLRFLSNFRQEIISHVTLIIFPWIAEIVVNSIIVMELIYFKCWKWNFYIKVKFVSLSLYLFLKKAEGLPLLLNCVLFTFFWLLMICFIIQLWSYWFSF